MVGVDDAGLGQTSDDEVNIHGVDDYSNRVGYGDDGYYDVPSDGLECFEYGEEYGEDSNKPMDLINNQENIEERPQLKRGRERAESGNPRFKKSGHQSTTHSNAPSHDPSPSQFEDFQGASRVTGGILRGSALGSHLNWGDAPQLMDNEPKFQSG